MGNGRGEVRARESIELESRLGLRNKFGVCLEHSRAHNLLNE
jgi:hypothetical protein